NDDLDDRVEEVTGAELADQFLLFDVDALGRLVFTIDDCGDAASATQTAGGSLANPIARLGRQGKRFAHALAFRMREKINSSRHASRDDHAREAAALMGKAPGMQAIPPA